MNKNSKTLVWISLVLTAISLLWLGYNSLMFSQVPGLYSKPEIFVNLMAVGCLVFFVSDLVIIFSAVQNKKQSRRLSVSGNMLIIIGVITLIVLLFHFIAQDQLDEDFQYGDPYAVTLKVAWITQTLVLLFFLYSAIHWVAVIRSGGKDVPATSVSQEKVFVAMNITGIVCSIAGLLLVLIFSLAYDIMRMPVVFKVIPYLLVLIPYILALAGWGSKYLKDKNQDMIDEKQKADINRSGIIALLGSLALMIILTAISFDSLPQIFGKIDISGVITVSLLPFYCFTVLLIFSVTVLYRFRYS